MKLISNVAAISLLLPLLSGCDFFDAKIVTICEAALKQRLLSPTDYKRVEISRSEKILNGAEYLASLQDLKLSAAIIQRDMRDFDAGKVKPVQINIFIKYDTPNSFGVPIRSSVDCEDISLAGDGSGSSKFSVKINGKTETEWIAAGGLRE
ncbi:MULTISPECIES: hypothetical protein [unclassified Rhizobium]|uniref:hypothetical protein n=1 Tax=unclassified Rhizobium TaxID=2613769 RepID=UPI00161A96A1|nr:MULTISPECIES: hypothetical protein [unclassified Rhizobium]MBB3381801.1 hypothetical protein [Rhizobium sp. BK098]MBB3613503.1 hypothetical protein [Rhizobium sp. BK609]MBB3679161.1 hypothetical protein [Rhizobium sp. BK612]